MRIQWLCAGAAQEISPKTATTKPDKPKAKRQSTKTKKASDTSGSKKGSKTLTARSGRQLARFQSDSEQGQEWKTELKLMADAAKQKEKGDDKMITSPSKKSRTPLNTSQSKLSGIRARTLTDKTGPQGASPSFQEKESMGEIVLADPERLGEIEALIASGTAEGNPCRDFGMFCDQENPQWFAVKVNQPDTSSALRVQSLVQYALKRHPKMTMPNGLEVTRQIEIVVPRKPIQAWSARSGKMGNRTITWKEGAFVMFKTIMDSTLAGYFQPWFLDPSDFWWKRMGATPRSPCITEFVNGLRIRTHYHIPRPCPESLLTEMNEWLETEEEWDEAKVTQNDSNAITSQEDRRPMDVREPGRADREQWRRVVERSGGRPLEELQTERLMLKGVINENVSHAESAVHSQKLAELESMDAGGWNVGIVDFKRQGHYQKRKQQPGRGLEFNRAKFAEDIGARRNTQRKTHFRNESSSSLPVNRVQGARTPSVSTSSPRMKDNSSGATGWYDGENDQYPWAYERDSNQGRNSWFTDEAVPSSSREASLGSQSLSSKQSRQKSSRSESKPADKIGWYDEDGKSVDFDEDSWLYGGKSSANGPPSQKAQSSDKPKSERLGREIDAVELASSDWKDAKDFWQEDDSWAQSQNQDAHPRSSTQTQLNQSQWYEGSDLNETPAPMKSGWYQAASALRDQNTPQKKSIPSKFDRFDRSQSSKALPDLEQGGMRKSDPKTSETRPQNSEKDTYNEDSWAAWDSENDWFSDLSSQSNLNAKFTDGLESQAANSPQNKLDLKGSLSPEEEQSKVDPWDEWSNEEVNDRRQGGGAKFGSARPVLRLSDFDDDLGLDNEPTSIQRSASRASSLQNSNAIQNKGSGSKFDQFAPGPPKSSLTRQSTRSRQANVNDQDATSRRTQNPVQNSPEVGRIAKGSPAIKSSSAVSQRSTKQDSQDDVWAAWDQEDSWFSGTNESSSRELSDTGTLPSDDTSTQESLRTGDKTSKVQQAMTNKNDSLTEESSQVFWADDMNFSDTASQVPTLPQQKAAQSRTFSHKDTSTGTKSNEENNIERNNEVSQARLHTVDGLLEGDEKSKVGNLAVGSMVRVTKGRYKGAEGDVINVRKTVAKIKFHDGQGQAEISIASCLPIVSADDF